MTKLYSDRPSAPVHRVVVLGAGYAGVLAANRILSSRGGMPGEDPARNCSVVVVNPRADFVERIRLHEVAAGTRSTAAVPLRDLLHGDAEIVVGSATAIDAARRRVDVAVGDGVESVGYDTLVYAVGSNTDRSVPGVGEHAHHAGDADSTEALRAAVAALAPGSMVRVVGGGSTAIEIAGEIGAARPDLAVEMVSAGGVAGFMRDAARSRVLATLRRLGVAWRDDTRVTEVRDRELLTADGTVLGFDVCVWAASFTVPDLAARSGLATDAAGRLRVDSTLTSIDSPAIVGAGDAVVAPPEVGAHLRMACAVAMPLGGHAAHTVLARVRGARPPTLSLGLVAQCMSLGRKAGYLQLVHPDDRPRSVAASGRLGAMIKESICRMTVDKMRAERTRPGAYKTPKGPRPRAASRVMEEIR
ncbi:NADH dehydrogenase FAD-containing subunit [Rhodococcus sp. AG1013]|uniref:NAD(P)/FAD-dependent oxidoreductase n=1 Tax=Rhodococcus sp. AG1013 TaxID=2183996 RepID=UPI000E2C555C|nr:FAD-dependent oxidoreductase [Rhodococcus sp. AG1013]RDI30632.1 NADH dehydrogenase FAD-containing subunit [Rhodococcus sp. AG1013]